jgi:predicted permease
MKVLRRASSILDWILHRTRAEHGLDDELRSFIDLSAAEKIRDGVPPAEARRQAMIELGGLEPVKESVRRYRHGGALDEVVRDVRYAWRMFVRAPAFSLIIVVTLALGIGANTAIFSLVHALMLRWLPVKDPQELVLIVHRPSRPDESPGVSFSYAITKAFATQTSIFSGAAGFSGFSFDVGSGTSIRQVSGAIVTGGFYETLGLVPVAGRLLTLRDDEPGAPLTAVISEGYWEREFARSEAVLGQTIPIGGVPVTIVGVSPRRFTGAQVGAVAEITLPAAALPQVNPAAAPLLEKGNFWLRVLARPLPGLSHAEVANRLNAAWIDIAPSVIAPHWPASRRADMAKAQFDVRPGGTGWSYLRNIYSKPLVVLMAAVALLLLVACANIASLLLARASSRQKEIAVRLAIGAGRGRIVRQLLIEGMILSLVGAALGVGMAWFSSSSLVGLISSDAWRIQFDLTPNGPVLAFTLAIAVATALVFGLAPALYTSSAEPSTTLKDDARTATAPSKLLPALVSAQVALSLVLLAGAGLFVRTLQNLRDLDPGFNPESVWIVDAEGRRTPLDADVLETVRRLPGVLTASLSTHTPLNGSTWSEPAVPAGQPLPEKDNAVFVGAGPDFFATMQIRLIAGREFTDRDLATSPTVAIVNQVYAARFFGNTNPVGQHLTASVRGQRRDLEIVGVAGNTKTAGLRVEPPATVYVAYAQQTGDYPTTLSIRTGGPSALSASALQQALQEKMPGQIVNVRALSAQVDSTMAQERMMATLAGAFGFVALTLACIGLYGLLAYTVARRTREIGIRIALGARSERVVRMVLANGTRLVLAGVSIGLPAAWAASRLIESMLFGLRPHDPLVIGSAIALLLLAALIAAYLPARRASHVDPLVALRHE